MYQSFIKLLSAVLLTAIFSSNAVSQAPPAADPMPMGVFITSVGVGNGADLGGLAGADAHCQELAEAVGSGDREWRAYLSTQPSGNTPAVSAVDRIGSGPWGNANGVNMGADIESLLYDNSNFTYEFSLTENGDNVESRVFGHENSRHDILTGSTITGEAYPAGEDMTCSNWTSRDEGKAMVGHSDRHRGSNPGSPWNSAHASRGCSQEALQGSGGDGLFYCFAAD